MVPSRKSLDGRPGPVPEIRADGDSVTFHLDVPGVHEIARMIIRCDADGNVWASIVSPRPFDT
jgi:hypothetical protein